MLSEGQKAVVDFCLDHAEQASVAKRVLLYRGLAEICKSPDQHAQLLELAEDLRESDQRCREFAFRFTNGGRL